jgi:DNA repair exonuclease SbcCD nuclease subunit
MRFLCLSDIHLLWDNPVARMDDVKITQFEKLDFVFQYAKKTESTILTAGDFFDKPRSWSLLPEVINFLKKYNLSIYTIFGQHDTYMYSEETRDRTNLGILAKTGLISLLGEEPIAFENGKVQIYGANFGQKLPCVKQYGLTIGVVHASISDKSLYPGHIFSSPFDFISENNKYDFVLCGDIHRSFYFNYKKQQILNSGPMIRMEATEYNFQHNPKFAVFESDDKSVEWIEIPHAKAELVLSRDHIERQEEAETLLDDFVKVIGAEYVDMGVSFVDNLMAFTKGNSVEKEVMDVIAKFIERRTKEGL